MDAETRELAALLAVYSSAIIAASLLGGWLPSRVRMSHTRTQLIMSFVAGLMLGVALFHLLPHSLLHIREVMRVRGAPLSTAVDATVLWLTVGAVLMLLLLRLFHFHQHDFSDDEHGVHGHREHQPNHHGAVGPGVHPLSWLGIALGLGLHTLIDGIALGAAIKGGVHGHPEGGDIVALGVFLAILLHKPLDALSITSMMRAGGWGARARNLANFGFAVVCPLGAVLFLAGVGIFEEHENLIVGAALAMAAGVFLCISLGDLLPEVQFHGHDRIKLTAGFLVGIVIAYSVMFIEPEELHAHAIGAPDPHGMEEARP